MKGDDEGGKPRGNDEGEPIVLDTEIEVDWHKKSQPKPPSPEPKNQPEKK